ncbi:MAG: 50S ribosomal protein L18 [Planctomycetota bacterium]
MDKNKRLSGVRERRRFRVRKPLKGDRSRPRLTIFRSLKHVCCQVIDDASGRTLVSASSRDKDLRATVGYGGNKAAAEAIGKAIAERALAAGINQVCFDRGHNRYHGRVAALADAARQAGLQF